MTLDECYDFGVGGIWEEWDNKAKEAGTAVKLTLFPQKIKESQEFDSLTYSEIDETCQKFGNYDGSTIWYMIFTSGKVNMNDDSICLYYIYPNGLNMQKQALQKQINRKHRLGKGMYKVEMYDIYEGICVDGRILTMSQWLAQGYKGQDRLLFDGLRHAEGDQSMVNREKGGVKWIDMSDHLAWLEYVREHQGLNGKQQFRAESPNLIEHCLQKFGDSKPSDEDVWCEICQFQEASGKEPEFHKVANTMDYVKVKVGMCSYSDLFHKYK